MDLLLAERVACPRCGPAFGLILLADEVVERRVKKGVLGCANCREKYPVHAGVADLRPPPRGGAGTAELPVIDEAPRRALSAAAATGIGAEGGSLLLLGEAAGLAPALEQVLPPGVELVSARAERPTAPGVGSAVVIGDRLPFFDSTFAGVVLMGDEAAPGLLRESARVLRRGHRVVVVDPLADAQTRLGACGLMRFVAGDGVAAAGR